MTTSPLMLRRHTGSRAAVVVRPVGSICHLTNRCTTIDASAVHNHKCWPNKHVCVHAFVCQKKNSLTVFLPLDMLFTSRNLIDHILRIFRPTSLLWSCDSPIALSVHRWRRIESAEIFREYHQVYWEVNSMYIATIQETGTCVFRWSICSFGKFHVWLMSSGCWWGGQPCPSSVRASVCNKLSQSGVIFSCM